VLEIGTRVADDCGYYSEIDVVAPAGGQPAIYTRRDGTPYSDIKRRGPKADHEPVFKLGQARKPSGPRFWLVGCRLNGCLLRPCDAGTHALGSLCGRQPSRNQRRSFAR
jgi:hypothetical protein